MSALGGKKILVAISGGIAAYKINTLVREFVKSGAEVKVILTPAAEEFVTKLTLATLSKNQVYSTFSGVNGEWNSHVELGLWADVMLVAPCTANTMGKMVNGLCDNLVIATYLSAKCPVFIAPAMDLDMYAHPSTKKNLDLAVEFGNIIIPAENGELASGLSGYGRMAEPETILKSLKDYFEKPSSTALEGKKILITAGPTYEAIDPVRFIGNHSSGKMGFAIAEKAAELGAEVTIVSGPTSQKTSNKSIKVIPIVSAVEMYREVFNHFENCDVAIMSAAVADYTPKVAAQEKIKKSEDTLSIELVKNPDILKEMGQRKKHQFLAGFALETENEEINAREKLQRKNLDMIVLNSLRDEGAGFQGDSNKITIITKEGTEDFGLKSKTEVAKDILDFIMTKIS